MVGSGTQLHPRLTKRGNEGSRLVRCKARDGILRRLGPQTLRTGARALAIKTPHAEKREIQWETQWAQRVDDWATWTSGRGIASRSSALATIGGATAAVYQPLRCNLIRALSHERTESALQAGPLFCLPLHLFFHLRSSLYPHLRSIYIIRLLPWCWTLRSFRQMARNSNFRRTSNDPMPRIPKISLALGKRLCQRRR